MGCREVIRRRDCGEGIGSGCQEGIKGEVGVWGANKGEAGCREGIRGRRGVCVCVEEIRGRQGVCVCVEGIRGRRGVLS